MVRRLLFICTVLAAAGLAPTVAAAQNTLYFSPTAVGVTKSIDRWGLDTRLAQC